MRTSEKMGLITINHEEFARLHNAKVLLRAHGEPPETYALAKANHIEIIDATCPVVLRLQKRIKQEFDNTPDSHDTQIVIYGKNGHAEVLGLVGQTHGKAIVIENRRKWCSWTSTKISGCIHRPRNLWKSSGRLWNISRNTYRPKPPLNTSTPLPASSQPYAEHP